MLLAYLAVVIWDQWGWWTRDEEYHFGFLVPFFVAFVLMDRWPALKQILIEGGAPGVDLGRMDRKHWLQHAVGMAMGLIACGGMLMFLLAGVIRLAEGGLSVPSTVLFALSFAAIALSLPYVFVDQDVEGRSIPMSRRLELVKLLMFPALVWLVAAPMPGFVKQELKLFLLDKVVAVVFAVFEVFGYPLLKEGNTFVLPEGRVGVADACSGIRSLTGCVVTGVFLAAVSFKTLLPKLVLVVLAVILAVLSNLARSLFLTIYAYRNGGDSINGLVHDATGYAVLIVTALCLWGGVTVMTLGNRDWSAVLDSDSETTGNASKNE